jgi:hypothetical protein
MGLVLSSFFSVCSATCTASVSWGCSAAMPHYSLMATNSDIQELKVYLLRRILIRFSFNSSHLIICGIISKITPLIGTDTKSDMTDNHFPRFFLYDRCWMLQWHIDYNRTYIYSVVVRYKDHQMWGLSRNICVDEGTAGYTALQQDI